MRLTHQFFMAGYTLGVLGERNSMRQDVLAIACAVGEMPSERFRFAVVDDPAALGEHLAAWEDLAAAALEPNLFYEPWMMLPAVEAFARGQPLRFVLVYAEAQGRPPLLCGLFPLERLSRYRGLPFNHVRLWKHIHCYLGTPLLRRSHARECLAGFLDWLAKGPYRAAAMEWGLIAGDGPFFQVLSGVLKDTKRLSYLAESFSRAVMRPLSDAATYLDQAFSKTSRKEFRRLERRLAEAGTLQYAMLERGADAERWIRDFLELEARGWKGRRGSALDSSEPNRLFFTRAAAEAARRGRLMMMSLKVADRPVAMKCNFLAQDGSFAFKIAYDEEYARFSPGLLLELEHIRQFHSRPALRWMDGCAAPSHFMANRLWLDRRTLVTLVTATGRAPGNFVVSSMPFLRWLYRSLRGVGPALAGA
jgi:CelD/BcsL family acetyltransferase involved in cellulose biosynthesis